MYPVLFKFWFPLQLLPLRPRRQAIHSNPKTYDHTAHSYACCNSGINGLSPPLSSLSWHLLLVCRHLAHWPSPNLSGLVASWVLVNCSSSSTSMQHRPGQQHTKQSLLIQCMHDLDTACAPLRNRHPANLFLKPLPSMMAKQVSLPWLFHNIDPVRCQHTEACKN